MALLQVARCLTLMLLVFNQGCHSQQPQCGMAVNNNRIVGGQDAVPDSWPWQVALNTFGSFTCGGSLINNQWVLTAAHCLSAQDVNVTQVLLGLYNVTKPGPDVLTRSVVEVICHPEYNPNTFDTDICLVKLSAPVVFSDSIRPICLASEGSTFHTGVSSWVTGFGVTDDFSLADVLQEVNVPIVGNNQCSCNYSDSLEITENMICAGKANGGMDSCQGDSGGPLMTKMSTTWVQAGIVSFGIGCGLAGRPGVYTLVSQYEDWIKDHVDGPDVGFMTFTSMGVDPDSEFVCPTRFPTTTHTYTDESIFDSGENLIHFTRFFFLCAVGLLLHVLVGGDLM